MEHSQGQLPERTGVTLGTSRAQRVPWLLQLLPCISTAAVPGAVHTVYTLGFWSCLDWERERYTLASLGLGRRGRTWHLLRLTVVPAQPPGKKIIMFGV